MKNNIIITVSGKYGSGKSRILNKIQKMLHDEGFNIDAYDGGIDYNSAIDFNRHMSKNEEEVLELIKSTSKISFDEVQLNRSAINI